MKLILLLWGMICPCLLERFSLTNVDILASVKADKESKTVFALNRLLH